MAFEWKALIEVAAALNHQAASAANSEAYHRSAVNRAYFAAYGHAAAYAPAFLEYDPRAAPEDHGRLREHFRRRRRKNVADLLGELRQLRNEADYLNDLPWVDFGLTVDSAIRQANEVFDILPPPDPRSAGESSS